jgi:hypothetical protein
MNNVCQVAPTNMQGKIPQRRLVDLIEAGFTYRFTIASDYQTYICVSKDDMNAAAEIKGCEMELASEEFNETMFSSIIDRLVEGWTARAFSGKRVTVERAPWLRGTHGN